MYAPLTDVDSPRAFAVVRDVIKKCDTEHPRCRKIATVPEETRLPKRLIDCTNPDRPRLVQSSEGECGRYVALSYVWGGDQPHKTTQSNVHEYELGCGMDLARLPQTIRDAIRVTYELGFTRLWVDSLCIVQDADEEKAHEIGRMHNIYRYAALTIAAARARHAGEGFLRDIQPLRRNEMILRFSVPILCGPTASAAAPKMGTVTIYQRTAFYEIVKPFDEQWQEPIDERAWCLQERLMSPRSLFFTSSSLRLRCQTATQPIVSFFHESPRRIHPKLPDTLFLQTPSPPLNQYHSELVSWTIIVKEYTRRLTSAPSDRLVACAAIAEAFHRILGDSESDYLAGLWRRSLLSDLLWKPCDSEGRNRRPTQYRAPSWSWAAIDGRVDMTGDRSKQANVTAVAEVVRCIVTLKNKSLPFGEVSGGSLILRTQLLPLEGTGTGRHGTMFDLQFNPLEMLLRYNGKELVLTDRYKERYNLAWTIYYDTPHDDINSVDYASRNVLVWAIPLRIHEGNKLEGLIIAQAPPGGSYYWNRKTRYRRIGWFHSLCCSGMGDESEVLGRPLKNKEVPLQEIEII